MEVYHFLWVVFFSFHLAQAASSQSQESKSSNSINQSQEESFVETPFTRYGEFSEAEIEEEDALFLQYGRFFGVSLSLGDEIVDGNRGSLWRGGFPVVDFKFHYWFNFNLAIDLGFRIAHHYFDDTSSQNLGLVNVTLSWAGVDLKYYVNTTNLSSTISFASPYFLIGAGGYNKMQQSQLANTQDSNSSVGISAGVGLEFPMSRRELYFIMEAKINYVVFSDSYSALYQSVGLNDLTGNFYTFTGGILLTW